MISHRSLAAVSVLLSDPFCFWAKSDAKLRPFFELCKFSSIFLKTFFSGRLRRSVGQGRFPFCGCKGTAICRTDKIFHRKNSNKFSQIFTHSWRPTTYTKNFFTCQNRHKKAMCEPPRDPHIILYRKRIFLRKFQSCYNSTINLHSTTKKKEMIYKLSRRRCDGIPLGIWCV